MPDNVQMRAVRVTPTGQCHNWCFVTNEAGEARVLITFSRGDVPPDRFAQCLDEAEARAGEYDCSIGCSTGPVTVNSVLRKRVADILQGKRSSVVADHRLTRGIVTALGWLGVNVQSFPWTDIGGAVAYLDVSEVPDEEIIAAVEQLRDLSIGPTK